MSNKIKGVFAIIFSQDKQKIVMVKRRDFPLWVIPGGGIDVGETPEDACIREVFEETGLKCRIVRKITEHHQKALFKIASALFECEIISGELALTEETKQAAFFRINSLPTPLLPLFREFIDTALMNTPPREAKLEALSLKSMIKFLILHPVISIRFLLTKLGLHINTK